jgi:hypothetical protein
MDEKNLLAQIIARLRDQRWLFLLGVLIVLVILASLKVVSGRDATIFFGISGVLVLVDRAFAFVEGRSGKRGGTGGGLPMSVVLAFEGTPDATAVRLVSGVCTMENTRRPGKKVTRRVVPYPAGSGWLCTIPLDAHPHDRIDFTMTDSDGGRWGMILVPDALWPIVNVRRLP